MDDKILKTLRAQAWERAKGEMNSVLATFWDGHGNGNFEAMDKVTKEFIKTVESHGLVE